jgi:cystathionine beta-synthase
MEIHGDIVAAIGNTPLVRLSRIHPPGNLVAKMEYLNPGGSIKDRIGLAMIERAERHGWLLPGGTIVEPTSGNTGVGLAMVAALRGYKLVAVMADKQSKEKQDLLRAYGAEVVVCPTDVAPEDPASYYSTADRLTHEIPGAYRPDQYSNPANPQAQYETTGPEIWRQTDGTIGAYVAGVGTGGTICGAGRYLKEQNPDILVVGVDPEGSIYTAPTEADVRSYLIEGVGEDFWPETFDPSVIDRYEMVTDRDAFVMTRRLAEVEGVLVGGSCGMAAVGALRIAEERPDLLVVVILPDGGRNYLSKIFNDDWMAAQGFLD